MQMSLLVPCLTTAPQTLSAARTTDSNALRQIVLIAAGIGTIVLFERLVG